ncbi:hypothetical protein B4U79_17671 [Dinothrombium tinctorium]|uniref:Arrestin-like N-terminal domain-containing protein n=1 Tax=Dinothrombium tinctorium TaxID=1965070 RepID=A0A443R3A5_9ACAR|nr:hypothetical protein B4U79_17671 [Dinothrombium tinctorium]
MTLPMQSRLKSDMFSCVGGKPCGTILNFDIYFSQNNVLRSDPVYTPGDVVEGYCVVHCKGRLKIDSIEAKFFGRAKANTNAYKDYQTQELVYFNEDQVVYEPNFDGEQGLLKDGFHKFKFSFRLPENIPSTFIHYHGYIKYSVKATIIKPMINQHVERFFTVYSPLDPSECEPVVNITRFFASL